MKYKLLVKTEVVEDKIVQSIRFGDYKDWHDYQLLLNLIRVEFEASIILDLKLLGKNNIKNITKITYEYDNGINYNKYDGIYQIRYIKPKKSCKTCVSYRKELKYCTWKSEKLFKIHTRCDGFLEKENIYLHGIRRKSTNK